MTTLFEHWSCDSVETGLEGLLSVAFEAKRVT
jgi:hypothetical protein